MTTQELLRAAQICATCLGIAVCGPESTADQGALRLEAEFAASQVCIGDVHRDQIDLLNRGRGTAVLQKQAPAALNNARFAAGAHDVAAGATDDGMCVVSFDTMRSMCFEGIAAEDYAISADGRWLAYNGVDREAGGRGMFVLDVSTGQRRRLSGSGRKPSWSPGGQQIVYEDDSQIRIIDRAGGGERIVANGRNPSWSPLDRIVYQSRSGDFEVVAPNGESKRTLGTARDFLGPLQWSPDGRNLLGAKVGWNTPSAGECAHDHISIVVIDAAAGERTEWNQYCGPGAWRFTWIQVPEICSAARGR